MAEIKLIISGFQSTVQAKKWWDWFEGQGEQCEGLPEIVGASILADCAAGVTVNGNEVLVQVTVV